MPRFQLNEAERKLVADHQLQEAKQALTSRLIAQLGTSLLNRPFTTGEVDDIVELAWHREQYEKIRHRILDVRAELETALQQNDVMRHRINELETQASSYQDTIRSLQDQLGQARELQAPIKTTLPVKPPPTPMPSSGMTPDGIRHFHDNGQPCTKTCTERPVSPAVYEPTQLWVARGQLMDLGIVTLGVLHELERLIVLDSPVQLSLSAHQKLKRLRQVYDALHEKGAFNG